MTKRGDSESGRSMVEMLGTLAIMGVLAIGGVAGYRWAMDKYRANDILNEVRKRAVVASQQRFGGSSTINFDEYGDNLVQGYALSGEVGFKGNNDFFTITVAAVDKEICNNLISQEMPLSVGMQVNESDEITCSDGATNTIAFGFSNLLDPNADVTAGGGDEGDSGLTECGEGEYRRDNGQCDTDKCAYDSSQFWNGNGTGCVACPSATNIAIPNNNSNLEDSCAKCDGAKPFQSGSASYCVYCPTGVPCGNQCCENGCDFNTRTCITNKCTSDNECDPGELCDSVTGQCQTGDCRDNTDCNKGSETEKRFCDLKTSTTGNSCTQKPEVGTCQPATLKEANGLNVNGHTWYRSQNSMNWWSAENFCKAIGKGSGQLVDPANHCSNWSDIKSNSYGYCSGLWIDSSDSHYYWTKRLTNSCNAFHVTANGGEVRNGSRNSDYYGTSFYALCE